MPSMIRKLLELIRFSHTIFALPFALLCAVLAWRAEEAFRWLDLVGILLCMVFARSAAMAFNRLVDRRYDGQNPRTASRHLPAGTLGVPTVVLFTLFTSAAFVASTFLFTNLWPLYLSGPVLLFILGYSLTKRFTSLVHFWLGASLMMAPVAAWIAVRGFLQMETPLLLGAAVLFWVSGFDILYACQDAEFDRKAGLYSLPARFGVKTSLRIAAVCHTVMFVLLVLLGLVNPYLGWVYAAGLVAVCGLLIYEHRLVKPDDLNRVNAAFFQVNGIISFGLFLVVLVQLAVRSPR
jgi:4-hydroxybenzoate polyprenyltransferase